VHARSLSKSDGYVRVWLPTLLTLAWMGIGATGGILSGAPPTWVTHWPYWLRLGLSIAFGTGVGLLSLPPLRKLTGGAFSATIMGNIVTRLGASWWVSLIVYVMTFLSVWYFFDWQCKRNSPTP
jgi:hypothetical protein